MINLLRVRKHIFPLQRRLGETFILGAALLSYTASCHATPPQTSAREQINTQLIVKAGKTLDLLAKQMHWQNYRYKLNLFIPPMVSRLPPCSIPLSIVSSAVTMKTLNHLNYSANCTGDSPWRVLVTVKPDLYVPVVMANQEIAQGEVLNADELMLKKFNISNQHGELFYKVEDVVGLSAKRTLQPMKPITALQLDRPVLVKRDQAVTIVSQMGEISAQASGVALKNGHKGDVIRVRNDKSQRVVSAAVEQAGLVKAITLDSGTE